MAVKSAAKECRPAGECQESMEEIIVLKYLSRTLLNNLLNIGVTAKIYMVSNNVQILCRKLHYCIL